MLNSNIETFFLLLNETDGTLCIIWGYGRGVKACNAACESQTSCVSHI